MYLYLSVVFFFVGNITKRFTNVVLSRKIVHILTGFSWFIYDLLFGCSIHQIIICFTFVIVSYVSNKFKLIKSIEIEGEENYGTVYYSISLFVLMTLSYFVPKYYGFVGFSVIALSIGDGVATIFGKYVKSRKIYQEKTLIGFISCIVFSFIALLLYNAFYSSYFVFVDILLLSIIVGIFEEQTHGLDNITVPFSCFICCILLSYDPSLKIAFTVFIALFLICFFTKLMTYHGSIMAAFIGASFYYIASTLICIYCASLYVVLTVIAIIKKRKGISESEIVKKTKSKDIKQVLANGLTSLIFLYLYMWLKNPQFLTICLITYTNSFIDSIASDVGCMSSKLPYDIFKRKTVKTGTSGGISALGTVSALISSILFSCIIGFITNSWKVAIVAPIIMMICCFFDTLLGSLLQVKYICECGLITEKEFHCGKKLAKYSGYRFFNNDSVNFICSLICGLISLIFFGLK